MVIIFDLHEHALAPLILIIVEEAECEEAVVHVLLRDHDTRHFVFVFVESPHNILCLGLYELHYFWFVGPLGLWTNGLSASLSLDHLILEKLKISQIVEFLRKLPNSLFALLGQLSCLTLHFSLSILQNHELRSFLLGEEIFECHWLHDEPIVKLVLADEIEAHGMMR